MEQERLIETLIAITKENVNNVQQLQQLSAEELNRKKTETSWSALECVEHLNLYSAYYHPEIRQRLLDGTPSNVKKNEYKSSWLGEKFIDSVRLKDSMKPMSSPKNMNPSLINSSLEIDLLSTFVKDQKDLLELLNQSRNYNLEKVKTSISISKLIKLRLGDTFAVIIHHNQRHVAQAKNAV